MRRWSPLLGLFVFAVTAPAAANGKFPAALQLVVDPGDATHAVLRTTFGLVTTRNAGVDWDWICEEGAQYSGYEPPIAISGDGSLFAGLYQGVSAAHGDSCAWSTSTSGISVNLVKDVSVTGPSKSVAVAITSENDVCRYWESTDGNATWAQVGVDIPAAFDCLTVDVAPSDPSRVYVSGLRDDIGVYTGIVARSDDHGASWNVFEVPGSDARASPYIGAIAPAAPDVVYVRLDGIPGRLLATSDGAQSWTEAFVGDGALRGFALSPDGARIVVSSTVDGVWRADAADLAFSKVSPVGARCLTWSSAGVYACGAEAIDGFLIASSKDEGATFTPLLHMPCIRGPLDCPEGTSVATECPPLWKSVSNQLQTFTCNQGAGGTGGGAGNGTGTTAIATSDAATAAGSGGAPSGDAKGRAGGCSCALPGAAAPAPDAPLGLATLWLIVAWARRRTLARSAPDHCEPRGDEGERQRR